jgi:hypothetical protein
MIIQFFLRFELKISNFRKLGHCSEVAFVLVRRNTFDCY